MNNNENQVNNTGSNVGVYKATTNLNTAIENPNIDVDSATGINIQNNQFNNNDTFNNNYSFDSNFQSNYDVNSNSFNSKQVNDGTSVLTDRNVGVSSDVSTVSSNASWLNENTNVSNDNEEANYEPVYEKKEAKGEGKLNFLKSRELKMVVFIAFLLLIFILLLPYLYDFFNRIVLLITSN